MHASGVILTIRFTVNLVDYIGPWWTCLVETGYVVDIGLS